MTTSTFLQIKEILDRNKVEYTHLTHEHVHRSEDAAKIRGTNLDEAAKAIIVKVEHRDKSIEFIQVVIPGDQHIDLKKLRNLLGSKNVFLASPQEVLEKTGCSIGSVPPFGNLFGIPVYVDESILSKEQIVFSAGTHYDSILLKPEAYILLINPHIVEIKKVCE